MFSAEFFFIIPPKSGSKLICERIQKNSLRRIIMKTGLHLGSRKKVLFLVARPLKKDLYFMIYMYLITLNKRDMFNIVAKCSPPLRGQPSSVLIYLLLYFFHALCLFENITHNLSQ